MQLNELKAILAKSDEVAMRPANIQANLDPPQKNRAKRIICPTGLVRGKVLELGVKWIERRPVSQCGDTDYDITRKNGILVEFDYDEIKDRLVDTHRISKGRLYLKRTGGYYAHTEVIERDGKQYVRMLTGLNAIFSAWGEYALIEAQRQKEAEEQERMERELRDPQIRIMGMTRDEFEKRYYGSNREDEIYLGASWKEIPKLDFNGHTVYSSDNQYGYSRPVVDHYVGVVELPLTRVNEILDALSPAAKKKLGIK